MAYDEALERRITDVLAKEGTPFVAKKMFGGVAFMVRGHMAVGIVKTDLMVRIGAGADEAALREPHVRPMDFAGRPMKGTIYVGPEGMRTESALARWVAAGTSYASTQPEKRGERSGERTQADATSGKRPSRTQRT